MNFFKILFLSFLVCIFNNVRSQYILTGEHICGQSWLNFSPAKIVYYSDSLDINSDNIKDFVLTKIFQPGGAVYDYTSFITPLGINEIVFDRTDTITANNCGTVLKNIPKTFNLNDTINANRLWKNSVMTFYYDHFYQSFPGPGSCSFTTNGIAGNNVFIGIRIISAIDTSYGWIQLGNISANNLTLSQSGSELKNYVMVIPYISQNGNTLSSNHLTGNQWFRNDTILLGATAQNYIMTQNGYYSLVVTENGCTSDTVSINMIDLSAQEYNNNNTLHITPNPFIDNLMVTLNSKLLGTTWELYNQIGEIVISGKFEALTNLIKLDHLPNSLYFLKTEYLTKKILKANTN